MQWSKIDKYDAMKQWSHYNVTFILISILQCSQICVLEPARCVTDVTLWFQPPNCAHFHILPLHLCHGWFVTSSLAVSEYLQVQVLTTYPQVQVLREVLATSKYKFCSCAVPRSASKCLSVCSVVTVLSVEKTAGRFPSSLLGWKGDTGKEVGQKGTGGGQRNNSHKQHKQQQIRGDIPLKIM